MEFLEPEFYSVTMGKARIPPGIEAIYFDAVGTLIHPDPPAPEIYAAVGQKFGSKLTPGEIGPRFARAFAAEEEADRACNLRTSEDRELRRWRDIVGRVLDDVHDPQACFQELYDHFRRPDAWHCSPGASRVIDELKNLGFLLGLASNYDRRLRSVADGLPPLDRMDQIIISSEVGWRKPAPEFFAAMSQAVSLPPEKILFIGDDPVNDYQGARTAGMHAILFDPHQERLDELLMTARSM